MLISTLPMKPGGPEALGESVHAILPFQRGSSRSSSVFGVSALLTCSVLMEGVAIWMMFAVQRPVGSLNSAGKSFAASGTKWSTNPAWLSG